VNADSQLCIVIVNWNAGRQLLECVDSVVRHGLPVVSQIIVVDNGSADGSAEAVEGLPRVTLLRAGENLGFARACNLGAAQADSEFLLFLNPDTRVFPDTLATAVAFMHRPENATVGICGVQLVDENGRVARSCARFPSVSQLLAHTIGLDRVCSSLSHFMVEWDHANTRRVDQVIGAFFLVRRDLFRVLKGFDERFFVYYEEVDFSLRARALGWGSVFLAETMAFHAGGGTSRQVKARRLFYSLRSRLLYACKHFSPPGAALVLLATLLLEPLSRSVLALSRRSWSSLKDTWSAYALLYRWLPAWPRGKGRVA
jgi:hypothetical protein